MPICFIDYIHLIFSFEALPCVSKLGVKLCCLFFFFKHLTTLNYHIIYFGVGRPLKFAPEIILCLIALSLENSSLNS